MPIQWVLFIGIAILSYAVQANLERKFAKYSKIGTANGMTGADVARQMLRDNGLYDVRITCVEGKLTDHYNPVDNTVNLSKGVYYGNDIASAAVAAHECGHAVQHAAGYVPVKLRSSLVPVVQFSSRWVTWVLLAGIFALDFIPQILLLGICLFAMTTLFSFVTLPVETDASQRAMGWIVNSGVSDRSTAVYARDALRAAAYTYVVAALSSLGTLIYYINIFNNRR